MVAMGTAPGTAWMIPVIQFAKLLSWTFLAVEIVSRIGAGLAAFLDGRQGSRLERLGTGFLLGLPCLGTALLGMALTGLFYPIAIWGLPVAMVAATWHLWKPARSLVADGIGETGFPGAAIAALAAVIAAVIVFLLLMPDLQQDSYIYHFGSTWQFGTVHRALFDWVPCAFSLSLPVEMTYIYPIMLGDDRLAKWIVSACFLLACAMWYSRNRDEVGERLAWLGPMLALASWHILAMVTESKNDIAASSFFVAGAILILGGRRTAGYALLGACAGAKYVYGPLILLFVLFFGRPFRQSARLALLAVPVLPWLLKGWLGTGDPLYPHGYRWFPNPGWDERNNAAFLSFVRPLWPAESMELAGVPVAWIKGMWADTPAFFLLLPLAVAFGSSRRIILVCLASQLATMPVLHLSRYFIPSNWLISLVLIPDASRLLPRKRWMVAAAIGAYAAGRIFFAFEGNASRGLWRDAVDRPAQALGRRLSTYGEAVRWLGANRAGRVLNVGGLLTYRIPSRVIYANGLGETPLLWKLARESRDPAEMRKKVRQTGAKTMLYNYVTTNWVYMRYASFPWDQRSLRLYVDFCKRYLVTRGRIPYCDNMNGGFSFYELADRPLPRPPAEIWWAPGIESVYAPLDMLISDGNADAGVIRGFLEILALIPDVGQAWNKIGHIFIMLGDFPDALKYLRKFGSAGMTDDSNLVDLAAAAIHGDELEVAEDALDRALVAYPNARDTVMLNRSSLFIKKAVREISRGKMAMAEKYTDTGLSAAEGITASGSSIEPSKVKTVHAFLLGLKATLLIKRGGDASTAREIAERGMRIFESVLRDPAAEKNTVQVTHAMLLSTLAEACQAQGDRTRAAGIYAEAARLYPNDPRASIWRKHTGAAGGGIMPENSIAPGNR